MSASPFAKLKSIPWPSTAAEAIALQKELRGNLFLEDNYEKLETIAGIDVSYDIKNDVSNAVIVVMRRDQLVSIETIVAHAPTTFPYIPGLLSFREIPVIIEAMQRLKMKPDLLMVDGQGIAHPRRLGIAAHLGVIAGLPSIGVAKSRLTGTYREPGPNKGDRTPLMDKKEQIGVVLRSKDETNPLFVSPGHRVSMDTAVAITLECLTRYRLPEPTRIADKVSKQRDEKDMRLI